MLFPKLSLATAVALGTVQLHIQRVAAAEEYPVYFDGSPYPNDNSNPMGGNGAPKKPKDWDEVDRVSYRVTVSANSFSFSFSCYQLPCNSRTKHCICMTHCNIASA
jgi:hypothetical protein